MEAVAKEFGMPIGAGGFMTAGGTLGNLTALLTARRKHSSGDAWNEGVKNQPQHVVLVSEQAHYCVERAVRIMGLGKSGVLGVPVDSNFKMQTQLLPAQPSENGSNEQCAKGTRPNYFGNTWHLPLRSSLSR